MYMSELRNSEHDQYPLRAEHGIAADRFAREIAAILKASLGVLTAAECQPVRPLISFSQLAILPPANQTVQRICSRDGIVLYWRNENHRTQNVTGLLGNPSRS